MQIERSRPELDSFPLPGELSSSQSKLVYLYLNTTTGRTATEIHEDLNIPRLDLFSILTTLEGHDLVSQDGHQYRCQPH